MADKAGKLEKKMETKMSKAAKKLAPIVFEDMAEGKTYVMCAREAACSRQARNWRVHNDKSTTRHNTEVARHVYIVKACPISSGITSDCSDWLSV